MKVLLTNGSPHQKGCTYTALCEVSQALNDNGIDTDMFWIGNKSIRGCIGCHACAKTGKCVFADDTVDEFLNLAGDYDGFVFGTPVHWGGACGAITSFLDRVFYADLERRHEPLPAQARRRGHLGSPCRHYRHMGPDEQILRLDADAHSDLPLLEYGPRCRAGTGQAGCRGLTGHARAGQQHGVSAALQGYCRKVRLNCPAAGADDFHKLYPLNHEKTDSKNFGGCRHDALPDAAHVLFSHRGTGA